MQINGYQPIGYHSCFRALERQSRRVRFRHRMTAGQARERRNERGERFGHPALPWRYAGTFPNRPTSGMNFVPRVRQRQCYRVNAGCPLRQRYTERIINLWKTKHCAFGYWKTTVPTST